MCTGAKRRGNRATAVEKRLKRRLGICVSTWVGREVRSDTIHGQPCTRGEVGGRASEKSEALACL